MGPFDTRLNQTSETQMQIINVPAVQYREVGHFHVIPGFSALFLQPFPHCETTDHAVYKSAQQGEQRQADGRQQSDNDFRLKFPREGAFWTHDVDAEGKKSDPIEQRHDAQWPIYLDELQG